MWESLKAWMEANSHLLMWVAIGSGVIFLLSLILVPIMIVRMPADYFSRQRPPGNLAWRVIKNVIGWPLVVAGVAMLVLPGQGLLTILLGLSLVDFPGKKRTEKWILSRGGVLKAANWLRKKYGKSELEMSG